MPAMQARLTPPAATPPPPPQACKQMALLVPAALAQQFGHGSVGGAVTTFAALRGLPQSRRGKEQCFPSRLFYLRGWHAGDPGSNPSLSTVFFFYLVVALFRRIAVKNTGCSVTTTMQ